MAREGDWAPKMGQEESQGKKNPGSGAKQHIGEPVSSRCSNWQTAALMQTKCSIRPGTDCAGGSGGRDSMGQRPVIPAG